MNRLLKLFGAVLFALLIAGSGILLDVSREQAVRLTHTTQGRPYPEKTPADYELAYEDVQLTTADGLQLAAWYVPARNGAAVLLQHGYKSTRGEMLMEAALLARAGYGVLLVEARGHGHSDGDTISFGLNEVLDVRAALDYVLARKGVEPGRIGALGNSQGAVTLLLAAARFPEIRAYVGNSPYASLQDEVATGVQSMAGLPAFPFAPLIQFFAERELGLRASDVAPIDHIASISPRPVFLMQGGRDTTIPADSGQRLFDAALEPKTLWFDPDLGHVEFYTRRAAEYERQVIAFFDQYLLGQ